MVPETSSVNVDLFFLICSFKYLIYSISPFSYSNSRWSILKLLITLWNHFFSVTKSFGSHPFSFVFNLWFSLHSTNLCSEMVSRTVLNKPMWLWLTVSCLVPKALCFGEVALGERTHDAQGTATGWELLITIPDLTRTLLLSFDKSGHFSA